MPSSLFIPLQVNTWCRRSVDIRWRSISRPGVIDIILRKQQEAVSSTLALNGSVASLIRCKPALSDLACLCDTDKQTTASRDLAQLTHYEFSIY